MVKAKIIFYAKSVKHPKFKIVRADNGKLLSYAKDIDMCVAIAECEGWELAEKWEVVEDKPFKYSK